MTDERRGAVEAVDSVLAALADPTRRQLLDLLAAQGVATATTLAERLPVSRQAVVKHLAVLDAAGLVSGGRVGREVRYAVRPAALDDDGAVDGRARERLGSAVGEHQARRRGSGAGFARAPELSGQGICKEETMELRQVRERGVVVQRVGTLAPRYRQPIRCGTDATPTSRRQTVNAGTAATAAALTATLGLAAAAWVVAVRQMNGMDMGVATRLGSFTFFVVLWVSMMAAMMLPGAAPAVWRRAQSSGRVRAVPLFVGSYLAVWTLVGVAVYRVVPAAWVFRRRRGCDRGWSLRVHAAQAALPPALPRERPVWIRVRALLRRLEHRPDADARSAGRHERRLDGS